MDRIAGQNEPDQDTGPLAGVRVLDFSTLLPGPLATLLMAEAGAEVIKVEREGTGDEMRRRQPRLGPESAVFALLNRGKRSVAIDLKSRDARARLAPLLARADVLVEQFRPGVMDRLGLGYEAVKAVNPGIVYCSIVGYRACDPRALTAGHDLNYLADAGLLSLVRGPDGAPSLPPALIGDIAGGSYPAVMNILLALRRKDRTGRGAKIEVPMAENTAVFLYWAAARGYAAGAWPQPGADAVTGGSPRYQLYRTADGAFIAVAALEDKFWDAFCDAIALAPERRDDRADPAGTRAAVADILARRAASDWEQAFAGRDVCCTRVRTPAEAFALWEEAGLLAGHEVTGGGRAIPALAIPIDGAFRQPGARPYPLLGEDQGLLAPPAPQPAS